MKSSKGSNQKKALKKHTPAKRRPRDGLDHDAVPAFLDASASVSATTFGARRLPEIKSLWRCIDQQYSKSQSQSQSKSIALQLPLAIALEDGFKSGGGKTASRHLRRRTTSHLPTAARKRHRFPLGTGEQQPPSKSTSRRARRTPNLLVKQHTHVHIYKPNEASSLTTATTANTATTTTTTSKTLQWIPTHLWHAKRFHMDTLFGWKVPLQHSNRGARAIMRMVQQEGHSTIQDVTWKSACLVIRCNNQQLHDMQRVLCPSIHTITHHDSSAFQEGMIHRMDSFPKGAIGPAKWWISHLPLDHPHPHPHDIETDSDSCWWVYLFVHSCILQTVEQLINELANGVLVRRIGIATLQLRGKDSTSHLSSTLSATVNDVSFNDIDSGIPHLGIVKCQPQQKITTHEPIALHTIEHTMQNNITLMLVRRKGQEGSHGVNGWDILCLPLLAKDIFIALNSTHGTSRAIGVIEEAHLCLDAELPMFPRDYPDTPSGQLYWNPGHDENHDMVRLRQTLENGWGRLQPKNIKVVLDWTELLNNEEPVVVRGNFGKPFLDLLQNGTSNHPSAMCEHEVLPHVRRRPRRKVRPIGSIIVAPPLTQDEAYLHSNACKSLSDSLSLPAILQCHLVVDGRGTMDAGDMLLSSITIADDDTTMVILGYVTAGAFSITRGKCIGSGFVSAARLLDVLQVVHDNNDHSVVFVIDSFAKRHGIRLAYCDNQGNPKGIVALFPSL